MGTWVLKLVKRPRLSLFLCVLVTWISAVLVWQLLLHFFPDVTLALVLICLLLTIFLLWLRLSLSKNLWVKVWLFVAPWLLSSIQAISGVPLVLLLPIVIAIWIVLGLWGNVHFYPFSGMDNRLHRARFAHFDELSCLVEHTPPGNGLILGTKKSRVVCVRPTKERRELGNMLIVGPTRCGKGLLATSQLLTWQGSVVVNDIKGDLFSQTAGYRSSLGPVFVIDPTGMGHQLDPLKGAHTEDEFFSAATRLLFTPDEGEGSIFTQRATVMLTQMLLAASREGAAPLPYARWMIRSGLAGAAKRLHHIDPQLAIQFLDVSFSEANLTDRFLLSAWGTLTARMRPLLTETVIRCLSTSDFTARDLLQSEKPISVYFRWPERDLLSLSPLVRLLWGSLIDELITVYDHQGGQGCKSVLLLIDEAGRTAIPSLADHATTVVGRGISLWIAIQSLSQLEAVYGRARAQVLRDNMESQIYYRPTDLATAQYLEQRLGRTSAFARSSTIREGEQTSEGLAEQAIPLFSAQDILQMRDEEIIGFHRRLPPFKITRMDWRQHRPVQKRHNREPPQLHALPQIEDVGDREHDQQNHVSAAVGYIDPDG